MFRCPRFLTRLSKRYPEKEASRTLKDSYYKLNKPCTSKVVLEINYCIRGYPISLPCAAYTINVIRCKNK